MIQTQANIQEWQVLMTDINTDSQDCQSIAQQFAQQLQRLSKLRRKLMES